MFDNDEIIDIYNQNFLLKYLYNYNYTELGMMTPLRRTLELNMLMERLEEEKKKQK